MKKGAGILSLNNELVESARENAGCELVRYRSFEYLKAEDFALLIIDAEYFEGEESVQFFLSRIRKKIQEIPVLLVSTAAKSSEIDLEWFFNDFIFYPFRKNELELRIRRMAGGGLSDSDDSGITIGNIRIDLNEYAVYLAGERLDLTYKEFELMRIFVQNRGKVFSRKELLSRIWGVEYIGGTRTVDVHIRRLRSKLGEEFTSVIETVRNVGYRCRE
ncbi:MAG: response regulator transcription factor [Spirochaetota bacterium]